MTEETDAHIANLARDMRQVLLELRDVVKYMKEAESEIPEKMRRFIMYMHDVHDIKNLYEEHGQVPPAHIQREMERCDDRYRQLLEDGNAEGGWNNKVRAEMTLRPGNRWDHSRILPKQETTE